MGRLLISIVTIMLLWVVDVEPKMTRVCGKALVDAVSLVCDGKFYGKRAKNEDTENTDLEDSASVLQRMSALNFDPDPVTKRFINRSQAMRLISTMQRVRRDGLANECCFKSCTIDEMYSYCDPTR